MTAIPRLGTLLPAIRQPDIFGTLLASPPVPLAKLRLRRPGRRPLVDPEHQAVESDHCPTLELQDRQQDTQVGEFEHGQIGPKELPVAVSIVHL